MTVDALPADDAAQVVGRKDNPLAEAWAYVERLLPILSSLKLTVVLFAMSIFLVFVGTLAQVNQDMWQVINSYFHSFGVWIRLQVFFPASWFPGYQNIPGGFPFPGGLSLGFMLLANLLAAHLIRFRIQATGNRMIAGLIMAALGVALTWLVIASGGNSDGFQAEPLFSWVALWHGFIYGLGILWIGACLGLWLMYPKYAQHKPECIALGVASVLLGFTSISLYLNSESLYLGDSGMRILWQLIQGGAAGFVLLAGCILLFRRRSGIVLIHSGIGLMMLGELLVGTFAVEQQISLQEGETSNFALDIRSTELAIIDTSPAEEDSVVVVPLWVKGRRSHLLGQKVIRDGQLPFDIEVVEYYRNARLRNIGGGSNGASPGGNPATAGIGLRIIAERERSSSGADSDSSVDLAAAYVKLTEKGSGASIDTYLVAQQMSMQGMYETVELDGRTYQLTLRFEREYKDYQVHLYDVSKEDYVGTDVPRDYASELNIVDSKLGIDRDVKVWMNNPVRYAGETFYQSGYHKTPTGPGGTLVESTTLSVVENTGWMIPYVSCMLVAIGLLAHFSMSISRFLNRLLRGALETNDPGEGEQALQHGTSEAPARIARILPVIVVLLLGGYVLSKARPPSEKKEVAFSNYQFGTLPIVFEGRVKPFDTLARNSLRVISDRETFVDIDDEKQSAIRWLLDVISDPDSKRTRSHQVFKIDHPEVVMNLFDLQRRKGGRYSIEELEPRLDKFRQQVEQAQAQPKELLNSYQRKVIELSHKLTVYIRIRDSHFLPPTDLSLAEEARMLLLLNRFQQDDIPLTVPGSNVDESWSSFTIAHARLFIHDLTKTLNLNTLSALAGELSRATVTDVDVIKIIYSEMGMETPSDEEIARLADQMPPEVKLTIATRKEQETAQVRQQLEMAINELMGSEGLKSPASPYATSLAAALEKHKDGDTAGFRLAVAECHKLIDGRDQGRLSTKTVEYEAFFNNFAPFLNCWILYIAAFVLVAMSWMVWTKALNRTAFWLMTFTLVLHTYALISRVYISGRPPVTNLYSSAVFIGWACVVVGLVYEWFFRLGIGNIIAATAGVLTLMIGHNLAGDGDTFKVLQAVLDTTFWLSTHVVCVTLGYATTFVAGGLGIIYIIRGVLTSSLTPRVSQHLARMIYGTTCFALFFSFVGTVLGGLWADDSWGRFWGWDPKENGALIIVIWNALILHARWGKIIAARGLAALAVAGNIVTGWSWFGVNELGVGLHSYGFTEGVLLNLMLFALIQLAIIGMAIIPVRSWKSRLE